MKKADIIIIGAGSGGLSVGLFLAKVGLDVIMVVKSDHEIGGECLNDGCVPSKALIHVAKQVYEAKASEVYGLKLSGEVDIKKVYGYIQNQQRIIRKHENAAWLEEQGVTVILGTASFSGKNEISVNDNKYQAKKIIIATGSKPRELKVKGVEKVRYLDNENIFHINELPKRLLVVGGGPIGVEISQAFNRLGSKVTVIEAGERLLIHDEESLTEILLKLLQQEGIIFHFNAELKEFTSANNAVAKDKNGTEFNLSFDAVFVSIGRELILEPLNLENAGIETKNDKIVKNSFLQTTNKDVFVCGDIAGDLQFSHTAEFHARIILNNLFSPIKKKLNDKHMSWVIFTDPQLATFGWSLKELKERDIPFVKLESDFSEDDRAVTDDYNYAKTIMYISKKSWFRKQKILGGTMVAPNAGGIIQELILANTEGLSINSIFNKIYPYPVAARINQQLITNYREKDLGNHLKSFLRFLFKLFN